VRIGGQEPDELSWTLHTGHCRRLTEFNKLLFFSSYAFTPNPSKIGVRLLCSMRVGFVAVLGDFSLNLGLEDAFKPSLTREKRF